MREDDEAAKTTEKRRLQRPLQRLVQQLEDDQAADKDPRVIQNPRLRRLRRKLNNKITE